MYLSAVFPYLHPVYISGIKPHHRQHMLLCPRKRMCNIAFLRLAKYGHCNGGLFLCIKGDYRGKRINQIKVVRYQRIVDGIRSGTEFFKHCLLRSGLFFNHVFFK